MKKLMIPLAIFLSSSAFAQQAPQDMNSAIVTSLQQQRNAALDQAAVLNAQLQMVKKELDDLKAADAKAADAKAADAKAKADAALGGPR